MSGISIQGRLGQSSAPTVLLVEDEEQLRLLMRLMLKTACPGVRVLEAVETQAALDLADRYKLDVVAGDGGLDRLKFLEAFKLAHPEVPVIFTSSGQEEQAVYRCGAFRYLPKPFTLQEFVQSVGLALRGVNRPDRACAEGVSCLPPGGNRYPSTAESQGEQRNNPGRLQVMGIANRDPVSRGHPNIDSQVQC